MNFLYISNNDQTEEIELQLIKKWDDTQYDSLFSFNFIPSLAKFSYFHKIPYIIYVYSTPLRFLCDEWAYNPYNYFFLSDNAQCEELEKKGILHVYHLPLLTDKEQEEFTANEQALFSQEKQLSFLFNTVEQNPVTEHIKSDIPISVCLIGKNEEKHVNSCLKPWFDLGFEIIVVDTGSTDKTMELARKYTNNVFYHPWEDHFAKARNSAANRARNPYILAIDFDEYLIDIDIKELIKKCDSDRIGMLSRQNPNPNGADNLIMIERVARLYNKERCHYEGRIHEQVYRKDGTKAEYYPIPLTIDHKGYTVTEITKEKAMRNLRLLLLDLDEYGADPYTYFQIGQSYRILKDLDHALEYYNLGLSMEVEPEYEYVQTMVESYGYCLLEKGDIETALQLENIYDEFCKRSDFVFLMGLIYMNAALFEEAISQFEKATTIKNFSTVGTNSFLAWYNAGVICEVCGLTTEALDYYHKCDNYEPALRRIEEISSNQHENV